jgi:hypothetical protein
MRKRSARSRNCGVDVLLPQRRRLEDVAVGVDRAVLDHGVRLVDGLVRGDR